MAVAAQTGIHVRARISHAAGRAPVPDRQYAGCIDEIKRKLAST